MRTYRRDPADVCARRVAEADTAGRHGKLSDDIFARSMLLHNPAYPQRTSAEAADAERRSAEDDQAARRGAARAIMLRGHGCTGAGCGDAAHGAHKAALDDALEALDLRAAPRDLCITV